MDETGSRMGSPAGVAIRVRSWSRVAIFICAVTVRGAAVRACSVVAAVCGARVSIRSVVAAVCAARGFVVDGDFATVLQLIEAIPRHMFAGVYALDGYRVGVGGADGDVAQIRRVV